MTDAVLPDTSHVEPTEHRRPPRRRSPWLASRAPGLAAAATVVALTVPRLGRRAVWLDEALTVGATRDLVATWRGSGGTMALYYLLIWPVTQVSTDRAWIRVPSMLAAAATVVVVHEVGRLIGGRRMAALSAGTLALTWAVSRFAVEARAYTLAMLLVSLSWLGVVGAVRDREDPVRSRRWWRLFVAASLLAPLAHGMAALHFAGHVAALALAPDRRRWLRACIPLGAALAAEALVLFAVGAGDVASWIGPLSRDQVQMMVNMLVGRGAASVVVGGSAVAACILAAAAYRRDPGEHRWLGLVPVFWALGTPLLIVALSVFRPYAESRYVISAVPGVALLVGGLLARIRRPALVVAAWLVVATSLWPLQSRVTRTAVEEWPALADTVAAQADDGDRLLMRPLLRGPFDYAWSEGSDRPVLSPLSPVDPVGDVQRFYDAAGGTLRAQLLADPTATVWYVERDDARRDDIDALLRDRDVLAHYTISGPWEFDRDLYLVRFDPRPGASGLTR